jgi:hypothetical protein
MNMETGLTSLILSLESLLIKILKPRKAVLGLFSFDHYCSTALAMLPNEKSLKNL